MVDTNLLHLISSFSIHHSIHYMDNMVRLSALVGLAALTTEIYATDVMLSVSLSNPQSRLGFTLSILTIPDGAVDYVYNHVDQVADGLFKVKKRSDPVSLSISSIARHPREAVNQLTKQATGDIEKLVKEAPAHPPTAKGGVSVCFSALAPISSNLIKKYTFLTDKGK